MGAAAKNGGIKALFRAAVMQLPSELRYLLSVLAFWPTLFLARCLSWLRPQWRRQWDRITPHVVLGAAPLRRAEVLRLHAAEGVRGVVNLCREWEAHRALYGELGIAYLHVPTIDFDVPAEHDLLRGAAFIHALARAGQSVYVHCKAGRGRSTSLVLAYLVLYCGLAPRAAHDLISSQRPHVSKKYDSLEVQALWRLRRALDGAPPRHAAAFLAAAAEGAAYTIEKVASTAGGHVQVFAAAAADAEPST